MNWQQLEGLELADIGQWPRAAKIVALCLLCVLWLTLGSYFLLAEKVRHWQHSTHQEKELSEKLVSVRLQVAHMLAMEQQVIEAQQGLNQRLAKLPSRIEVAPLLDELSVMINAHGLRLERIHWEQAQAHEFATEWPMRIIVHGDYHQLGHFVAAVAALPQLVIIDEFSISRPKSEGAPLPLTMNMIAKTYTYQEEVE